MPTCRWQRGARHVHALRALLQQRPDELEQRPGRICAARAGDGGWRAGDDGGRSWAADRVHGGRRWEGRAVWTTGSGLWAARLRGGQGGLGSVRGSVAEDAGSGDSIDGLGFRQVGRGVEGCYRCGQQRGAVGPAGAGSRGGARGRHPRRSVWPAGPAPLLSAVGQVSVGCRAGTARGVRGGET